MLSVLESRVALHILSAKPLSHSYRTSRASLTCAAVVALAPLGLCRWTLHHPTPRQRTDGCLHGSELCFRGTANPTVWATFPPVWPHTDHPSSPLLARTPTSVPPPSWCAQVPVVHLLFAFLSTLGGAVYPCGFRAEPYEKRLRNRSLFLLVSFCHPYLSLPCCRWMVGIIHYGMLLLR